MTKRQRAQVVELLRCAADVCQTDSAHGLYSIAHRLDLRTWDETPTAAKVWRWACDARYHVHANGCWYGYWHECLEAAARVEEGTWP